MKKTMAIQTVLTLFSLAAGGCDELEKLLGSSDNSTEEDVNF